MHSKFQKLPEHPKKFQRIPRNSRKLQRLTEYSRKLQRVPENFRNFQRVPENSKKFQIVAECFKKRKQVPENLETSRRFQISGNSNMFQKISRKLHIILENSSIFQKFQNFQIYELCVSAKVLTIVGSAGGIKSESEFPRLRFYPPSISPHGGIKSESGPFSHMWKNTHGIGLGG